MKPSARGTQVVSRWPIFVFPHGATAPSGTGPPHHQGFTITLRHTTLGRTPLDEGPARRRDLYLTTHNSHKRQTSKPPVGFEPTIPVSERPQTHALDRAVKVAHTILKHNERQNRVYTTPASYSRNLGFKTLK
jgi:hypothetical protein